tara:strand:+ start:56 stop:235 length:180 start_codon:yes stop_codon:yes gene_type:complete
MSNNRTGPDYLDHAHRKKKKRRSTEGGYQSPDGKVYPGLKLQHQEPKRRRSTAVHKNKK